MIDPSQESAYRDAQRRVRRAHDEAKHVYERLEQSDNRNEDYPFNQNDEHIIRAYTEAWKHLIESAHRYYGQ